MLCWKCGGQNNAPRRFCGTCGVVLPIDQSAIQGTPNASKVAPQQPSRDYPNPLIERLAELLRGFWAGEVSEDEVFEHAQHLESLFDDLIEAQPAILQAVRDHLGLSPDDQEAHQLNYLIEFGTQTFETALSQFPEAFQQDPEQLDGVLQQMQVGNNYLSYSAEIAESMLAR